MILISLSIPPVVSSSIPVQGISYSVAPSSTTPMRIYGTNVAPEIYVSTTQTSYESFVFDLTENGSRYMMTDRDLNINNINAREWIIDQLTTLSAGRIEIDIMGNFQNIIGRLPGYLPGDNPGFVVTANYDSADNSPGANDNGSGVAVLIELARVMSNYEWPLDIYFYAFNGANSLNPLAGSNEVAMELSNEGMEFLALFNVDTLLYQNRNAPMDERILLGYATDTSYHTGQYWAELAKMIGSFYGSDIIGPTPMGSLPIWESSNHYSFYQRSYKNVLCAYESGYMFDAAAGTVQDDFDNARYAYFLGRHTTSILAGTMAFTMSREYGEITHLYPQQTLAIGGSRTYRIAITTPTILNVTSRWFGGGVQLTLFSPTDAIVEMVTHSAASAWEPSLALSTAVTDVGLYRLVIENVNDEALGYEADIAYETDVDANGVLDHEEYWLDTALFETDSDSDSLSDALEIVLGTDPNVTDSDLDTMPDGWEYEIGFDPTDASDASEDADEDGLTNAQEYSGGLNPLSADSDNDSIPDLWELENGLDPLVPDAELDLDGDGRTNLQEYLAGTDPQTIETPEPMDFSWTIVPSAAVILICVSVFVYRKYS